jgi:tetratricopeptide (TPR) repeat protein
MNAAAKLAAVSAAHPFPGLRPFGYQDHPFFFGRQDQIFALYRLVDRFRFVAIVGSSGSGKSSLVRAGLLPLFDLETSESGGRSWIWREMRPGDAPLKRLTNLLASLFSDEDPAAASGRRDRIAARLRRSSFGLSEILAETLNVTGKSLVLLIDQFEELFRYAGRSSTTIDEIRARDEATQFVQLLLEASRHPSARTHVLITMRSDFIGDCSRFHGLPEAVCDAQFLVPSLTRDQLDEVIRLPIEKAGAAIEPQLIERLLNDCSTEIDQLPVLQHCLSRLWDEAGKAIGSVETSSVPASETERDNGSRPRRLITVLQYRRIGEFAGALSQHADEILREHSGAQLEQAVRQVFSALSELDKEGRATRRALKYSQLVAETGVEDSTLRQVLDRFRANDCSFLIPPPSEAIEIEDDTRIDVGHEALLRRWDKVSGSGAEVGWLRVEQQAGERYRGLLALAEGEHSVLPAHLVDERWAWWIARPRTPAWAERYGGGFVRVQNLLVKSRRRQSAKRWMFAGAFLAVFGAALTMLSLWQNSLKAQEEASRLRKEALEATEISISRLAGFLDDGTLRAVGAEKFLEDAKVTLDQISRSNTLTPELVEVEIRLLLAVSDVKDALGDLGSAINLAIDAEARALRARAQHPDNVRVIRLLYASKFRVADQLAKSPRDSNNAKSAERRYLDAVALAREMAHLDSNNPEHHHELIFVLNKVGDMHQMRDEWSRALEQYQQALEIARSIAALYPGDTATERNRLAQLYSARNQAGDKQLAVDEYREALKIQQQQQAKSPLDASLISNIAITRRRLGELLKETPEEAQQQFQEAVDGHKGLYNGDPGNLLWATALATDYSRLGDLLARKQDWRGALRSYNEAARIADGITSKNPKLNTWQKNLAALNAKRGDMLVTRGKEIINTPPLPVDESARLIGLAAERYRASAETYGNLLAHPSPPYRELFEIRIKIGHLLVLQNKYHDALNMYQSAGDIASNAGPTQDVEDRLLRLSSALEDTGDTLRNAAEKLSMTGGDFIAFYKQALAVLDNASSTVSDNSLLQSRRDRLLAKLNSN